MSEETTITMSAQEVCPRMQDIFNMITGNIDARDAIDVVALASLSLAIAKEFTEDISSIFEAADIFADVFTRSVERHLSRQESSK